MDTVNVFSPDLRNKVRKEVPFLPVAWVEFYDDITIEEMQKAQEYKKLVDKEGIINIEKIIGSFDILINQISSWNFSDESKKILPININTIRKLPSTIIDWLTKTSSDLLQNPEIETKKKTSQKI